MKHLNEENVAHYLTHSMRIKEYLWCIVLAYSLSVAIIQYHTVFKLTLLVFSKS